MGGWEGNTAVSNGQRRHPTITWFPGRGAEWGRCSGKAGWSAWLDSANTGGSGHIVGLYQHQIERLLKDLGLQAGPAGTTQLKNPGLFRGASSRTSAKTTDRRRAFLPKDEFEATVDAFFVQPPLMQIWPAVSRAS